MHACALQNLGAISPRHALLFSGAVHRGVCDSANLAAGRMFGYSPDELVGENISRLMPSPFRQEHDSYLEHYLRTGEKQIIGLGREVVGRRRCGAEFPAHLSVSEFRLGDRRYFTGVLRDLTESKEYERRMVQSERLAAVGQAVTSLAHESRNLLQTIVIAAELIRLHEGVDPQILKHLACIETACDGLNALLEEVREYAAPLRIDAEGLLIQRVITDAWESALQAHPGRRATLHHPSDLQEKPPCDRFRMFQVFRNLFDNSLAACEDPVEVTVLVNKIDAGGRPALSIVVRDNGPGLNQEQQARIFEPFFTTKAQGTGLGMAIAQRIMQAHAGSLSLGAGRGSGAEFFLELPL